MGAKRDWPFLAFVVFAALMFSADVIARARLARAFARFGACAASADAQCAAAELAAARDVDPKGKRTAVAQAQLYAVLFEADKAERALRDTLGAKGEADLADVLRGEVLLLRGDIAALRFRDDEARARWIEATPLVDDSLVDTRRTRLDADRASAMAALGGSVGSLRTTFDDLFATAREGESSTMATKTRAVEAQIARLPVRQRDPFTRALEAVKNVAVTTARRRDTLARDENPGLDWNAEEPRAPTPEEATKHPWVQADYERRLASFQQMQAQKTERNYGAVVAQTQMMQAATDAEASAIAEAQRRMTEAFGPEAGR